VTRAPVRVGVGGWVFAPWRGRFYPKGLRQADELAYASQHLTTIEINATFYRHQARSDFAKWRDATPTGFVFTVKAHRATTHAKNLGDNAEAIRRFLESGITELGPKLGPILWQLPHNKKFDPAAMEGFLAALPARLEGVKLRHAVEARHASFLVPDWPALAARYGVAIVMVDSDKQTLRGDLTGRFVYARLQRNDAAAPEGYDATALDAWRRRMAGWSTGEAVTDLPLSGRAPRSTPKRECFMFFISGDKERAPEAALAMLRRLENA
jgi:uncharacterized protein YecE (DUF72 family)